MIIPFCQQAPSRGEEERDGILRIQEDLFMSFESVLLGAPLVVLPTPQTDPKPAVSRATYPAPTIAKRPLRHLASSPGGASQLDLTKQVDPQALFTPSDATSYALLRARECSSHKTFSNWQDRLVYNKRHYMDLDLLRMSSNSHLSNSSEYQSYVFYRRLLNGFTENWVSPKCLLQAFADPDGGELYHVSFYLPPFRLAAVRINSAQLGTLGFPGVRPWLGPSTVSQLFPQAPFAFLNSKPASMPQAEAWPPSLATFGKCFPATHPTAQPRVVMRHSAPVSVQCTPLAPAATLQAACANGNLLAINSCELDLATLPVINVVMFIGGKDMLALDWLPYISRFFHFSVAQKYTEVLNKGEKSSSWQSVIRDDATGCQSAAFHLLYEYPGYGFSTAPFNPALCVACGHEPLIKLLDEYNLRGRRSVNVHLVGYSLGSSVTLRLGQEIVKACLGLPSVFPVNCGLKLASMLILAPPTTISDCAIHALRVPGVFRGLANNVLARLQTESMNWDNIRDTEDFFGLLLRAPLLYKLFKFTVLHGDADTMVATWMGEKMVQIGHDLIQQKKKELQSDEATTNLSGLLERVQFIRIPEGTHLSLLANPQHQKFSHFQMLQNDFLTL